MHRNLLVLPFVLLGLFGISSSAQAQKGTVAGTITSNEGGSVQPLPFVNVVLKGTTTGATTDLDGKFSFPAEPGTHTLQVSFVGYEPAERTITVVADQRTIADVEMKTQGIEMAEFEVVQVADREREGVLVMERKETTAMVQKIGAQELKKKGAGDVAEGVQKLVGLSTVGGRYVVVRGLTDRYNSAYLNGMPLPSPDPDMKVAPLDIFPTDIVESISVTKAFTPELYGDFSGGAVDIGTKRATGENILKVSLGGGLNTQSTFRDHRSYNGGGNDFWGRDDGTRSIPAGVLSQGVNLNGERLPFAVNFNPTSKNAAPDLNFGIYGGTTFKLGNEITLNVVGTGNYRNENRYRNGQLRIINTSNTPLVDYTMESWQFNTQTSALGSASLDLGKRHGVGVTSLWVNMSSDEHRINYGEHFDYQDNVYARRYTYRQNTMLTNQIFGRHAFGMQERLLVEWSGAMSTADAAEPDRRQLVYLYTPGDEESEYRFNAIDRLENHRWFSALQEEETTARAGVSYRLLQRETAEGFQPILVLRTGAQSKQKSRDFGYDIFAYSLQEVNAQNPNGVALNNPDQYLDNEAYQDRTLTIAKLTGPEAKHTIEQSVNAAYFTTEVDVVPQKVKLMAGARLEEGDQRIIYRKQSDSFYQARRVARIQSTDLLPFASVKYDINKKDIVRASFSKTISRPGFREMAPFEYTEFFAGTKNIGNPDLKNGENYNADLRFERFFGGGELIAVGAFGKVLDNTIEKVALATASGQLQSFRNTGRAEVYGVELEVVKNIGAIVGTDSTFWNDLSVGMNASLLHSQLTIVDDRTADANSAEVVLTNDVRPLQGASPYLINFDLSYSRDLCENVKGTFTVAYNVFGKRVFAAGANGLGDQYELPVNTLNVVARADIGKKWQANITCRNVLDARFQVEQETPAGTSLINDYRIGPSFSAGISYRIF
ncbi:MAG: carboxypeptidase-like regulatory domain-containing protein [Flavobacteriales bacterium]|nr:carboxypeptidase-like regulatory domain-containing protein [Flavobacteriales bacterium]